MAKSMNDMVASAKEAADMTNYDYVSDSQWEEWINRGIEDLWDSLREAKGASYYSKSATVSVSAGTEDYTLASDFLYMLNLFLQRGGQYFPMEKFSFADEPFLRSITSTPVSLKYHIVGATSSTDGTPTIKLLPVPTESCTIHYRYVYKPPTLTGTDEFDGISGWEEYAELLAAKKALSKKGVAPTLIMDDLKRVESKLLRMKGQRDAMPAKVKNRRRDEATWHTTSWRY